MLEHSVPGSLQFHVYQPDILLIPFSRSFLEDER